MSAYMVEDETIEKILSLLQFKDRYGDFVVHDNFLEEIGVKREEFQSFENFGRKLLAMNRAAVNARYKEEDAAPHFTYKAKRIESESMQSYLVGVFKAVQCFTYQCSEGEVFKWELFKQVEQLQNMAAAAIVRMLPEYEKVSWG